MKNNIRQTVIEHLCMGCGICSDICPHHCITIHHGNKNRPIIDEKRCTNCGKCLKVCAGRGIDIDKFAKQSFNIYNTRYNKYIGYYIKNFSGYSLNNNIRYHCASGGCLSSFLIYLLKNKYINGAVVTSYKQDSPMTPQPFIAQTEEEILKAKSSKYCVVSMDSIAAQLKEKPGKFVIVGLPCHIHAFRKLANTSNCLKEKIIGYFPLFCSANKNMKSQEYILWRYNVDYNKVAEFAYRDEGCLGSMFFKDSKGNKIINEINFLDYYCGVRAFFNEPRCNICTDFFGELGDICFGDLNKGDKDDDPIGINSIIVRSEKWLQILLKCQSEGFLKLSEIDEKTIISAQSYCTSYKKGEGFWATWNIRKWLGIKNPEYGSINYTTPHLKAYINALAKIIMYEIGKHEKLWIIIKFLDKNKK